ncbi:MAG: hypothetical protein QNJ43_11170, partial [Breoghania sp.]|nr:hypothetical protein [Breoghania sp.]
MTTSEATPEVFWEELSKPQELDSNTLMPADPAYYERLVRKLENSSTLEAYARDELAAFHAALMKRHPLRTLRRIALTALWQR